MSHFHYNNLLGLTSMTYVISPTDNNNNNNNNFICTLYIQIRFTIQ